MSAVLNSIKWVFSTIIIRRLCSFLLFLYIVRHFSRADLGVFRQFMMIVSFSSLLAIFSFNNLIIVEKSRKLLRYGLQFILLSSVSIAVLLFIFRSFIASKYQTSSEQTIYLSQYLLYGFWLVIPLAMRRLVRSVYELDMRFRFLSIVETLNTAFYCLLTIALFMTSLKFEYYAIAFFAGSILELAIMCYPLRGEIFTDIIACIRLKYITPAKQIVKEHFAFLSLSTAPTALNLLTAETPIMILGLFYSPDYLGKYFIASQFVSVPVSFVIQSFSAVLFPTFSLTDKKELPAKVHSYFRHTIYVLWLPILAFGVLLRMWGYLIIGKSDDIAIITAIIAALVIKTLFTLILSPLSTLPTVLKKPQYELYWSISTLSVVCLVLYIFSSLDFLGMIYLYIAVSSIGLIAFTIMICRMIDLQIRYFSLEVLKGILYNLPVLSLLVIVQHTSQIQAMILLALTTGLSALLIYKYEKSLLKSLWKRLIHKKVAHP